MGPVQSLFDVKNSLTIEDFIQRWKIGLEMFKLSYF